LGDTLSENIYNANKDKLLVYDEAFVKSFIFSGFPSTLKIEVAKRESLDVGSLLKARDTIIQGRKDKKKQRNKKPLKSCRSRRGRKNSFR
jgi:CTP-dependent riboflavin kinase